MCRHGSLDQLLWGTQASIAPNLRELQQLKIMSGIAAGVAFLHKNGVCHRDLKSPNVPTLCNIEFHSKMIPIHRWSSNFFTEVAA